MNRLLLPLVLGILVPIMSVNADMMVMPQKSPDTNLYPGILQKKPTFKPSHNANPRTADLIADVSPDYRVNKNILSLTKVPVNKHKRALQFVFLMNKNTYSPAAETRLERLGVDPNRNRMHVLWPWSKKMNVEQKVIDDEYPVDMSVANKDDGYAAEQWNVVLPYKKPKEVSVALMWSF